MSKETTTEKNIEERIEEWHESHSEEELHDYLGIPFAQYARWVETGELHT
ncbi:hypothetical protein IMZ31_23920 (plasmid) [Pontibacillus sp. ALD_SL1]|nr:hypothetical protein [Pontibacillus sp. ALD_SL1]QST02501.1 hypothetical protein IMZ31_23920 [Pontibacillus sp. ALD_SL1]